VLTIVQAVHAQIALQFIINELLLTKSFESHANESGSRLLMKRS